MPPLRSVALTRLIAGHISLHACMAGMRMAAPLMALREGYSALAVGLLLSLFALTQVFLALPAGRYADRNGFKRPVGFCVLLASAGAGLAVAFPVFPVLCLSALMTGGATGVASISLQRHVGRSAQNNTELKRMFSWLSIGPALANFVGPLTAGLLIDLGGFRVAFFALACMPLMTWLWVRHTVELPPVPFNPDAKKGGAWDLLRDPMMRRLMLVNWLLSSCWDVHTFVVPVLGHERGLSASAIGAILGSFALAATAVRVALPFLATRLHEWVVVTSAMLSTALLFALYPFMPSALTMGLCSVLLGISLGSVQPMIMSTLHQITPEARHGEALGIRLMAINASSVLMPMLFGSAGAVMGVSLVFWTVGAAVAAGARAAWHLRPPAHKP
ncbi:MAG: MFS transporter [Rhodoferax sp.]|nr:MFS transporter [Rhodoferax sp.]MDP1531846.1 MFS transporter [Rhodoferax sp.]MDP1944402.1 MFS transporter [Rhodoferax sp.]MDP2443365.1 MFS transporter [Rhodoferax sp.]MDZ4209140.1 MFS transporter [Rhodoferax sp.]